MRLLRDLTPHDAARHLSVDEALLDSARRDGTDAVRLWVSRRAVVVGRSQVVDSECDRGALARHGIPVVRRISGGGAVYHYPGNLNLSLTTSGGRRLGSAQQAFAWFGAAIAEGLRSLGVPAEARERSVVIGGRKASGAAQARRGDAVLLHATLLVSEDAIAMDDLLLAMRDGYAPVGTPSRPSPTTTLSCELDRAVTIDEAADAVSSGVSRAIEATWGAGPSPGTLASAEAAQARRLERDKYRRQTWNEAR